MVLMGSHARRVVLLVLLIAAGRAGGEGDDLLQRCRSDPTVLREERAFRDLPYVEDREGRSRLLASVAADASQPWDVRARALMLTDAEAEAETWRAFARAFKPVEVAADAWGDETFNVLARWMPHRGPGRRQVEAMLLAEVDAVVEVLAGRAVHDYLVLLVDRAVDLRPEQVRALGDTDDQDTRRLLNWLVGHRRMGGMEAYLVDQVVAERPSTYPDQGRRLIEFAFTGGLSELLRAMAPEPVWLGTETTPKGLALSSLGALLPAGTTIEHRPWVEQLLSTATAGAAGTDRGRWQLAVDILDFLHVRGERLSGRADAAVAALVRQGLRRRGPLAPFVAAERLHREAGVALPRLRSDERSRLWDVTLKSLDADYLVAVSRAVPDRERQARLEEHLRSQREAAVRGSLRVVRCWGCTIEGPGRWAHAVAALGMDDMLEAVEKVLELSWGEDDTVRALVAYGEPGVPALVHFLTGTRVNALDEEPMVEAIALCAGHLEGEELESFTDAMRSGLYTADAAERVLGPKGP
jgi:hypothetical protein